MNRPSNIRVEIDELILHGYDPRDRHAIGDAVQAELARLLTVSAPNLVAGGDQPRIDAGRFDHADGGGPAAVGRAAAGALHRSLT